MVLYILSPKSCHKLDKNTSTGRGKTLTITFQSLDDHNEIKAPTLIVEYYILIQNSNHSYSAPISPCLILNFYDKR